MCDHPLLAEARLSRKRESEIAALFTQKIVFAFSDFVKTKRFLIRRDW
jgi:hypothetical protein